MANNGSGITESLVHAPVSNQGLFPYRAGTGIMASAEWNTYHDDFNTLLTSNTPAGWSSILETTGTWATSTSFGPGVIAGTHATASNGVAIYLPRGIQLAAGKKFFMEVRLRTDDVTDNQVAIGLFDQTSTAVADAPFTTTSASLISFGILDGSATTKMLCDKSNSGSTAETGTKSLVANTWHTLAIGYDGISGVRGYVDGSLSQTWAQTFGTTVPLGIALSPFVAMDNGDGAGGATILVDYVRFSIQR
jgi:hypothetical protein